MKSIPKGYIETSAMFSVPKMKYNYIPLNEINRSPQVGDVVYGKICSIRQHSSLENRVGRIHHINEDTRALFVFANRYAPDYYEAIVPEEINNRIDLIARSGLVGSVVDKNDKILDPTQVKIFGYVCDGNGTVLNTLNHNKIKLNNKKKKGNKLILSIGTNMNSGKTTTAAMCCWALSKAGHNVTASKITGTASLKDILLMQDSGASKISDFTYFGYPSTYMISENELIGLFEKFDSNNNESYWVVEFADGILQRETKMLMKSKCVKERIHRVIFNAHDTFSAIGGIRLMREEFSVDINAISGVISGSPLLIKELSSYSDIPVINNIHTNSFKDMLEIIL